MYSEYQFNSQALILSTLVSFLSVHSNLIEKPLFRWFNKRTGEERKLLLQKSNLKNEQSTLNMVDEFAKYSKIQRRINTIDVELERIKGDKVTNGIIVQLGFTYGVKFVLVLLLIALSLYYRYTPVFYLGDKINLVPLTNFICYPNEVNYVSFHFWIMCSAAIARLIHV